MSHTFNAQYQGEHNQFVAFPMGGIGAGMVCLEGMGALSHFSLWHKPSLYYEPPVFAALCLKGGDNNRAIVLEGQAPSRKIYRVPGGHEGLEGTTYGLPRFERCGFTARFPFGSVDLSDDDYPLTATVTGWSPFIPGNADDSSLPAAALEYSVRNPSGAAVDAVFSFHVPAFAAGPDGSRGLNLTTRTEDGFVLEHVPEQGKHAEHSWLGVAAGHPGARVYCRWFRGGWYDTPTMLWKLIESGECPEAEPYGQGAPTPGASLFVPLKLAPGETQTVRILLSWYVPQSDLNFVRTDYPESANAGFYTPWYASRFPDIHAVMHYWEKEYGALRSQTKTFSNCFYSSTLPPEVVEAAAANLSILKSPTILRESSGRLWGWEGCEDNKGSCAGSCTHVWNYAQAMPHLFPSLERTMRDLEFNFSQDASGHQNFRTALPLRDYVHEFHAAADGQLGGILKVWRDWRICGDTSWLKELWPKVRQSLDYCIATWDPDGTGVLTEPHHNTYDIEFWGPDGMCSSIYLGALQAAAAMAEAMGQDGSRYVELAAKGRKYLEGKLFNGEYFTQEVRRTHQREISTAGLSATGVRSAEAEELFEAEGPKYQYGAGCLADGVLGAWMAAVCGFEMEILDAEKVKSHLRSLHGYNLKKDLSRHANFQRPGFALGHEGGLLLCTWPHGGKPSLPFIYSDEVWTGIEYQAASHMMLMGQVEEGLEIVRTCRSRYDGRVRNPFDEYECGHWYTRAMSSWALLQALSGAFYDAVDARITLKPKIKGDFACFVSTASGYGLVGVKEGRPFLDVAAGSIHVAEWDYVPA